MSLPDWSRAVRFFSRTFLVALVIAVAGTASCGKPPSAPTPPPPVTQDPPSLACPADTMIGGVTGFEQPVNFPAPTLTGGAPPVAVTCSPAIGAPFPIGPTNVVCTARDNLNRQAFCTFTVTLVPAAIGVEKFVAFGDSVTEGENGIASRGYRTLFIDLPNSYPTLLQNMLRERYPAQNQIEVINEGLGGERATESLPRLASALDRHRPQVLLLLNGYNDLLHDGEDAANDIGEAIRDSIREARGSGVQHVLVSTLPPSRPGKRQIATSAIEETNRFIRQVTSAEGAILVDPYPAFLGQEQQLVSDDGLHLTPAGNRVLAEMFFARMIELR
jgi:lysophospholipase L1-like esterase